MQTGKNRQLRINPRDTLRNQVLRTGFSLIEVMVVITMLTVIMSLTGMTFYLLIRTERVVSESFVTERAISRLAVQFRDDIHRADTTTIMGDRDAATSELVLDLKSGSRIRYVASKHGLSRQLFEKEKMLSRDDFLVPHCQIWFTAGEDANRSLRALVIQRPGPVLTRQRGVPLQSRPLQIHAYLRRPSAQLQTELPADAMSPEGGA